MKYLLLFSLISCASISQNLIKEGEFALGSGQGKDKKWDTEITFKRASWFSELSLIFDVFYTDASKLNDFNNWLSDFEMRTIKSCDKAMVAFVYDLDDDRYSKTSFYQSMREQKYEVLEVPSFSSHLRLHPDFEELSFSLYDVKLLCKKKGKTAPNVLIPSFRNVSLKP